MSVMDTIEEGLEDDIQELETKLEAAEKREGKLVEDIEFLAKRAAKANSVTFCEGGGRETGASSNSIVAIAYGTATLEGQNLPFDQDDLNACRRMWAKLPKHRKTPEAIKAQAIAEAALVEDK